MTDEEWARLKPLAEAVEQARARLQEWRASNSPLGLRERIESRILGRRLAAEISNAEKAFRDAQEAILGTLP